MLDMLITGRDVYDGTEGSIPLAPVSQYPD